MKRILEELSIMHIKLDTILDISDKNTDLDDEIDYLHNSLNWFKTKLSDIEAKNKTSEANLNIGVVSSFVFVLKAKDREEPLWLYKTYQKAYREKKKYAKLNWTNTYIEKWKIS